MQKIQCRVQLRKICLAADFGRLTFKEERDITGPIKTIGILKIIKDAPFGYKVRLKGGQEKWINRKHIIDAGPGYLVVPEWYFKKEIARTDLLKEGNGAQSDHTYPTEDPG